MTDDTDASLKDQCHFGAVAFSLSRAAAGVSACHCQDCQRMHGNFNAFLAAPVGDVWLTGAEALVWYQSSDAARHAFCGTCGARVLKEVTSAGLIDGSTGKRIIRNLWETSKPDWCDLPATASEGTAA